MDLDRRNELGLEKTPKWHLMVLVVSFNQWWRVFIGIQCILTFALSTYVFAYKEYTPKTIILRLLTDFCYLFEIICTITYRVNPNIRKMKYFKARGWFFIFIDIISVIPLDFLYLCHYVGETPNATVRVSVIQNRTLRIYRVILMEISYERMARKPYQYIILFIFQYSFNVLVIGHVLTCIWVLVDKSLSCDPDKFTCFIWYSINMWEVVFLNWSGPKELFRKPWERLLVSVGMLLGYFIVFAHFYPKILHFSMQQYHKQAVYYDEFKKLQVFCRNMVHSSDLKGRILKHFNDVWEEGRTDPSLVPLLKNIPLALRKDINTDIYWDSLRHSELFREISRNCKRSLSLLMRTEYYQAGEVVFDKGREKIKMMFLLRGSLQIMAEENEEFPVVSLTSGTVLGETSLFFFLQSQVILKSSTRCEVQVLTMNAFTRVLKDYPKDSKLMFRNLNERISLAKHTQWRKQNFTDGKQVRMLAMEGPSEDCVKLIKQQWKAIYEINKRHVKVVKAKEQGLKLSSWHKLFKANIRIDFISNYLDLVVLSEIFEENSDLVCFNTRFPWSLNPSAQFLHIWRRVVFVISLVPALAYPVFTAWTDRFSRPVFLISYFVTLFFMIDVALKLLMAVQTEARIITQFLAKIRFLLLKPTFYCDVLAAFPYQLLVCFTKDIATTESYKIGLYLHPALLKSYVFMGLNVPLGDFMDKATVLKNCLIYCLLLFWTAEIIQLIFIRRIMDIGDDWVSRFFEENARSENLEKYYLSLFNALSKALGIPDFVSYPNTNFSVIGSACVKFFFFVFTVLFLIELYGNMTIKIYGSETFLVLLKRVTKFLHSIYVSQEGTQSLMRSLNFQWKYDKADYLTSKTTIIEAIPPNLRKEVYVGTTFKTLEGCALFEEESSDFLMDVLEKSYLVPVPKGSVLVTFGHTSHLLCVIHRGYCQVNSFLSKDIVVEVGRSIEVGPGTIFPLLSSFCCIPSPVSVITVTDCEVIMIHLNDLLHIMMKHDIFKDLVETLKTLHLETKLKDVRPGLVKVNLKNFPVDVEKGFYKKTVEKIGLFRKFLYSCCPRKNVLSRNFFRYCDLAYSLHLIVLCGLWPCCFGLFLMSSHIIIPVLTAGKLFMILHLILRFNLSYYNKNGLLITHPAHTCTNYLTSSFLLDLIRVIPVYQIYLYGFANPKEKPKVIAVLALFFHLFFKMAYVMGFLSNQDFIVKKTYFLRMVKITLGILFFFNLSINFLMYLSMTWIFDGPYRVVAFLPAKNCYPDNPRLLRYNSPVDYYIFTAYWTLCCLTTTDYNVHKLADHQYYASYILAFIGNFGVLFLHVWIASNLIFSNIRGTIYQEKVFSFIGCLKYEEADESLVEYTHSYYNFEWSQTHGESVEELFEHLPTHLHEELVYPIYRSTFSRNKVFQGADEGFFKILAIQVKSVYFNRGSVIIFQGEVQSSIYFVHKGKCFVYDWFQVLESGSIIGDIQQTGLMQNKVYALTHVEVLKIQSVSFFNILNSFDSLEAQFLYRVKNAENFVKSDVWRSGQQLRPVDSKDVLNAFCLKNKDIAFEDESVFEDPENSLIRFYRDVKFTRKKKTRLFIIYPGTWKMRTYLALYFVINYVTLLSFPIFLSFGGLTDIAFAIFGVTDCFWFVLMLLTFRVGVIDNLKGDVVTDLRIITKAYAGRKTGFFLDVLALIPFEVIPIWIARGPKSANEAHVALGRMFRLLRVMYYFRLLRNRNHNLDSSLYMKNLNMILLFVLLFFYSAAVYIIVATEPSIVAARNAHELTKEQFFAFVFAFEYVINLVSSTNLLVITPETKAQLYFFNVHAIAYVYLKSILISEVLSFFYKNGVATTYYKSQILELEAYLSSKDTSPCIIQEVLNYRTNLLLLSRSENMPSLLSKAPATIRMLVMQDIYIQHLIACPIFEDVDRLFLNQLVARGSREFYFPGQKIVEQGDVDRRMYFIHSGEVYVIGQTKEKAYVEFVVRLMQAGESFGESQGLWFSVPHAYTYRARTLVEILVVRSDDWSDLRSSYPEVARKIFDKAKSLRYL